MSDRHPRVVELAVRKARGNRTLRQRYNLGWIGWITLGVQLVQLIMDLVDALREKERVEAWTGGAKGYEVMRSDGRHDPELLGVLEEADGETPGG